MMKIHELKTWPKHFNAIWEGRKHFEFRFNDRDFQIGDFLLLKEYEPSLIYGVPPYLTKSGKYTGKWCFAEITYLLTQDEEQPEFVPDGWCILSIKVHTRGIDQKRAEMTVEAFQT